MIKGGIFGGTEVSKIGTEIIKIEPNFSTHNFIRFCRYDVIPNLLESIAQEKEEIVKDWCSEAVSLLREQRELRSEKNIDFFSAL